MMLQKMAVYRTALYVLLVSFILVGSFASLGTVSLDIGDIYYIQAPTSGFYGKMQSDLSLGISETLIVAIFVLLEGMFATNKSKILSIVGIVICCIRVVPIFILVPISLLLTFIGSQEFQIELTIFAYFLALLGMASFIVHIQIKKLKSKVLSQNYYEGEEENAANHYSNGN